MGALPLGLPKVSPPEFSRMGGSLAGELGLGASLLPVTAETRPKPPRCRASLGVQMDSHRLPLLERSGGLRREEIFGRSRQARFASECAARPIHESDLVKFLEISCEIGVGS